MAHVEAATLPAPNGNPDPHIEAVLGKIHGAPADQQELLARDAFLEGGYRRLASNMISLAIRDLIREPKVPPAGKNKAMRDAQDARDWLDGEGSDLSFADCLAALGMDAWREGLRQFILENPESASELFRAYERSYYEHLDPAMSTGLPAAADEDMAGEDPLDISHKPITGRELSDGLQRSLNRYGRSSAGVFPHRDLLSTGEPDEGIRLPTLEELGIAAAVGAQDTQRHNNADDGWAAEPMRPH